MIDQVKRVVITISNDSFRKAELPSVSVVILNWNGGRLLEHCVSSVLLSNYPSELLEVVVVDNASVDGSAVAVKRSHPNIVLVSNSSNLGFCQGNNIGIERSKGELVILLNSDTEVPSNWLIEVAHASIPGDVGVIGSMLEYGRTGIIQSAGFRITSFGREKSLLAGSKWEPNLPEMAEVDYVSGAALAVKRSILQRVGSLDPYYFAYVEDLDFCYRVKRLGKRVTVATKAEVYHYVSQSWRRRPITQIFLVERNRIYFIHKFLRGRDLILALVISPWRYMVDDVARLLTRRIIARVAKTKSQSAADFLPSIVELSLAALAGWLIWFVLLSIWPAFQRKVPSRSRNLLAQLPV